MPARFQTEPLPRMDLTDCRAQLIWANERDLEPRHLHLQTSFENVTVCWLITRGRVHLKGAEGPASAGAGEWMFPSASRAEQRFSPRARILSIRFLLNLPGGEPLFARRLNRVLPSASAPELERAGRELIGRLQPWSARESLIVGRNRIPLDENLRIEAAFFQWLSVYTRCLHRLGEPMSSRSPGDERVRQALIRLENFPFHQGFSEGDLARECGLSVNQLNRLFKRETGDSPFQYYDRLRLERARHALSETAMQVKEIAYELGFSSSPHFTNWFKQRVGVSPSRFRKEAVGKV